MKVIHKFPLQITDYQEISMPVDCEVVLVENQFELPCIWAVVDTEQLFETRGFYMIGTGIEIPEEVQLNSVYLGTAILFQGSQVYHIFGRTKNQ